MSATPFQALLADHSEDSLRRALQIDRENTINPAPPAAAAAHPLTKYNNTRYEAEKRQGLRKKNGARKLKKLTNRHLRIISMHLEGKSGEEISTVMGCTFITVSRVLNDPLATDLLSTIYRDRQGEIDALAGRAIDAVRQGLISGDTKTRLTAVDKFAKLKDTIGKEETSAKTAEDVVQEIFAGLKIDGATNVQVNIGKRNG